MSCISLTFKSFRILFMFVFFQHKCFTLLSSCMVCNKKSTVILTSFLDRVESFYPWDSFKILILSVCLQLEYIPIYRLFWSLSCLMFVELSRSVVIWYSFWNIFSNYFFQLFFFSFPLFSLSAISVMYLTAFEIVLNVPFF